MNPVTIISSAVGIIGCIVGVATFIGAQMTKSRQDGMLIAKIDQCVKGIEEIKADMKDKNHEYDKILDEHTKQITQLQTEMKEVFMKLNTKERVQ